MATRMGIRELRDTLTQTIRRVRAGETIEVTHDGEPVVLLTPIRESALDRLIAEGRISAPQGAMTLPVPRPARGRLTATDALRDDRDG
ncbi:MAG: type II toxin-antitoxin system Phd/YefM family antitoxin [Gaiellaceae bacterium]